MPQRQYDVEADPIIPDGFWPGAPLESGPNRSDLEQLMLDAAVVLERIGGTFSIVSLRQELVNERGERTGLYVTTGYRAKWESFAPAQRAPEPAPAREPEPEPAPEPAASEEEEADLFATAEAEEAEQTADDDFGPDAERALAGVEQG